MARNGSGNLQAPFLDLDELPDLPEELLQQEPVPWNVLLRLALWEFRVLWRLSWASVVTQLANFMFSLVSQMFVGHLGDLDLAGASITNIGVQGLAYGIMIGMSSAVQTVCGQAYGAKKYREMGIICQRALILHFSVAFLLAFFYWYSGSFLRLIGQEDDIAAAGQLYARGLIVQLFAFAVYCPLQRYLQAQNIVNPLAFISVAVLLLHTVVSYFAVFKFKVGLVGTALTLGLSWWLMVVLVLIYVSFSPNCRVTWTGPSVKAFNQLWPYTKLTFASCIMLVLEIWYMQGPVFLTGYLTNPEISLDALSICINYWNWDIQLMLGLSNAASVRISNELGAGHPRVAKFSILIVLALSVTISIVISILVVILKQPLSILYTTSTEVLDAVMKLIPLLSISIFLNGIQPILSGVAIGSGWQAIVAFINVGAYYVVGLPIALVLGIKTSLAVNGVWWGLIVGVLVQTCVLVVVTVRTDWNKEVAKAVQRVKNNVGDEAVSALLDAE